MSLNRALEDYPPEGFFSEAMTHTSPSTHPVLRAADRRYLDQANAAAAHYAERAAAQASLRAYRVGLVDLEDILTTVRRPTRTTPI